MERILDQCDFITFGYCWIFNIDWEVKLFSIVFSILSLTANKIQKIISIRISFILTYHSEKKIPILILETAIDRLKNNFTFQTTLNFQQYQKVLKPHWPKPLNLHPCKFWECPQIMFEAVAVALQLRVCYYGASTVHKNTAD